MDTKSKLFRTWLLTGAATGMAMMVATSGAFAQDGTDTDTTAADTTSAATTVQDDDEDREVLTVTGIRSSIANSIAAKRESTSIVEAISSEDIGKLPDVSIAESLARLPGLAAQRLRGRAQVISVRGLGPDFTTALLNGREQVTAGDNRGVEFDQYPSELLSQVLVYKTPDASLLGQGLAGTADLRTIRPLSFGDRSVSFNARYEYADIGDLNAGSKDDGYRFTGTYVDQFNNDTVGLVLGFAIQSSPTQAERWDAWGYPSDPGALVLGGAKPYVESRELERTAFMGTLEFEPDANLSTSIDAFYSAFEDSGILRGIELPLFWSSATLEPGYTVSDGFITDGTFSGVQGVVRNDFRGRNAEVFSGGWNAQFSLGDNWNFETDLSFSRVTRDDVDMELYAGTGSGAGNGASDTLGFMQAGNGNFIFDSQLDYADPSLILLTDPQGWGQVGYIKEPKTEDQLKSVRLEAERTFGGPISSVEFGVNYSEREKKKRSPESFIDLANPGVDNAVMIPDELLLGTTSLDFIGIAGQISFDPWSVYNSGLTALRPNVNDDVVTKEWVVNEDVWVGYVKANVDTQLGAIPVTGNFGLQVVNTEQSSTGASVGTGELIVATFGDEYTELLPSANFNFDLGGDFFLRAGAARTLARARMDQLSASQTIGRNLTICNDPSLYNINATPAQVCLSGGGGNPMLHPYIADSFDVSLEKYFGGSGYVSAAAFYKDLKDFVAPDQTVIVDFGSVAQNVLGSGVVMANPELAIGTLSAPVNGDGGYLQGLEFAASIPGDLFLPAPLDGFGVIASVSFTESEIKPAGETEGIPIPGLSETVGNVTLYYEKGGFEARISNRYRSDFLGEVTGFGAGREFRQVKEENVVDAQLGYEFLGGALDGVSLLFQVNNLTDEEFGTYLNDDPRQVKDYQVYGRTYLFGINYRH